MSRKLRRTVFAFAFTLLCLAFANWGPIQAQKDDAAAVEKNKLIIRRYFEEAWNKGELAVLDELLDADYINHSPSFGNPPPGPGGLKPIIAELRSAFPDLHFTIEDMVVTEDAAAVRVTMYGTHKGDLFGIPPTGRKVVVKQLQIERIRDGRIVEHWRQSDDLGMMRQLGQ